MLNFSIIDSLITSTPKKVAVAVSGGADSMCLIHMLSKWCKHKEIEVIALIVDHGLRQESGAESLWVKEFLTEKSIKAIVLKWKGPKPKANIQNQARIARYGLIEQYCSDYGIEHVFIGHTLNDQAETVLMRIIRGSGIDGISGIEKVTKYGALKLLRPLLSVTRQEIESYLERVGWKWVNDPSNLNHKYDRIKVRSMLNSYSEEFDDRMIYERISLLSENARRAKNFINKRVDIVWNKYVKVDAFNSITLDNATYKLHEEIKLRIILRIFKYFRPKSVGPKLTSLTHLLAKLQDSKVVIKTLGGCIIKKNIKCTIFILEVGKNPISFELQQGINIWYNLKINVAEKGLFACMLGANGWKYLKSLNYSKPPHIPIEMLHSALSIYRGTKLVYVPILNFKDNNIQIDITKL